MSRTEQIKKILIQCFPESASGETFDLDSFKKAINGETDLSAYEVGLDSLDLIEAVIAVEDELDVEIRDDALDSHYIDCTIPLKDLPSLFSMTIV